MKDSSEREWTARKANDAALRLVSYLKKLGFIDSGNKAYSDALTDSLPIAYFAISGCLEERHVIEVIAEELKISAIRELDRNARTESIKLLTADPCLKLPQMRWREICAAPLRFTEGVLHLAVANPFDRDAMCEIEFALGCKVIPTLAPESEIDAVLGEHLSISDKDAIDFIVRDMKRPNEIKSLNSGSASSVTDDVSSAPTVRLVNKIFSQSVHCRASDLHLTPQKDYLSVKVRVDGIMRQLFQIPNELRDPVISRIKVLCGMDISEKRLPQDGRLRFDTPYGVKDLRISTVPATYGENIVARILSSSLAGVSFDSLGMNEQTIARFKRALKCSSQVHLVTGPTGSGKTSTLYTTLMEFIDGERNIITLEDPIEYRIEGITQIQINPKLQLNFAEGLRSILRQDPDVVLVGEIRDEETASISMKVAQTGHVVLSTLHTNTAEGAITRLRDLGIPPYLIASSVGSVMAQRLVRTLCPKCKRECNDEEKEAYSRLGLEADSLRMPVGCDKCSNVGYLGRQAVYSFLQITEEVREEIRTCADESVIARTARKSGYLSLQEAAREFLELGETSVAEVERVIGALEPVSESDSVDSSPLSYGSSSQSGETLNGSHQAPLISRQGKPRVLLVEDDEDTRKIFQMFLEKELFQVEAVGCGNEALEAVYKDAPDLIISDFMMPVMSGLDLLQRIRSDKRLEDIPVLMLTANTSEEVELKLIMSGASDYVTKTTKPEILAARARRLIHHQRRG